jgi:serine/threonine-protein kinase
MATQSSRRGTMRLVAPVPPGVTPDRSAGALVDDRFLIIGRVGVGGSAVAYCAQDLLRRRTVVLKVLHEWLADDRAALRRFRREALSASEFRHPNIVTAYGSGEWNGRPYIILEYVPGRSLKSLAHEEAPPAVARAVDLTAQLMFAVRYIHQRGIVHRDLKGDNAIVDANGHLKLTDFGLARPDESDITRTGVILGTAHYMSPEQAQGERVSTRSDLYSVGVTLYEQLTGRLPFESPSAMEVMFKHVHEQATRPSVLNAAVTSLLDAVVMRALEKDPTDRFADADAFIAALGHAQAGVGGLDQSSPSSRARTITPVRVEAPSLRRIRCA